MRESRTKRVKVSVGTRRPRAETSEVEGRIERCGSEHRETPDSKVNIYSMQGLNFDESVNYALYGSGKCAGSESSVLARIMFKF